VPKRVPVDSLDPDGLDVFGHEPAHTETPVALSRKYALPWELAEFQEDAVEKAHRILARYDGVMIADFVGLGKTLDRQETAWKTSPAT
jgi:hypothetical protein